MTITLSVDCLSPFQFFEVFVLFLHLEHIFLSHFVCVCFYVIHRAATCPGLGLVRSRNTIPPWLPEQGALEVSPVGGAAYIQLWLTSVGMLMGQARGRAGVGLTPSEGASKALQWFCGCADRQGCLHLWGQRTLKGSQSSPRWWGDCYFGGATTEMWAPWGMPRTIMPISAIPSRGSSYRVVSLCHLP